MSNDKQMVRDFWESGACGEALYLKGVTKDDYRRHADVRYRLEPYIEEFACFREQQGRRVLEIGLGLGADHQRFAEAGADLTGMDLTWRAIEHTRHRLKIFGLESRLLCADAERLPFPDERYDLVYSWGVLHHTPDTRLAIREVHRVLKAGGTARVMLYHKHSIVGFMLWLRYALFRLRPWMSLDAIYSRYLESAGTQAFTVEDARQIFSQYREVKIKTLLTHGDLLESQAGQRHEGILLKIARVVWPRWLIRAFFKNNGLFMLVESVK